MNTVAIMQPYFLPYVGYFQLIQSARQFVVYDNIQYTKKGWVNRNRFLQNGKDELFSIPLKKDSDFLDIRDREISPDFNKGKLLNRLREAYRKAPCFEATFPLVESIVRWNETNLFAYIEHSIRSICSHLAIDSEVLKSSELAIDHSLHGQDKVLALCQHLHADVYINAIGGQNLYAADEFRSHGIELKFLQSKPFEYPQFGQKFVPWLSIVDVLMFNPIDDIRGYLSTGYELI